VCDFDWYVHTKSDSCFNSFRKLSQHSTQVVGTGKKARLPVTHLCWKILQLCYNYTIHHGSGSENNYATYAAYDGMARDTHLSFCVLLATTWHVVKKGGLCHLFVPLNSFWFLLRQLGAVVKIRQRRRQTPRPSS
jgi:hypothetical protein